MTAPATEAPGYNRRHRRVYRARGKAHDHACAACMRPAHHWATIHGRGGHDPYADYVPLCHHCHHAYDDPRTKAHALVVATIHQPTQLALFGEDGQHASGGPPTTRPPPPPGR